MNSFKIIVVFLFLSTTTFALSGKFYSTESNRLITWIQFKDGKARYGRNRRKPTPYLRTRTAGKYIVIIDDRFGSTTQSKFKILNNRKIESLNFAMPRIFQKK